MKEILHMVLPLWTSANGQLLDSKVRMHMHTRLASLACSLSPHARSHALPLDVSHGALTAHHCPDPSRAHMDHLTPRKSGAENFRTRYNQNRGFTWTFEEGASNIFDLCGDRCWRRTREGREPHRSPTCGQNTNAPRLN